jgi:outer membrane protein TolC
MLSQLVLRWPHSRGFDPLGFDPEWFHPRGVAPRATARLAWYLLAAAPLAGLLPGCKSSHEHVEDADREVYAILERRREELAASITTGAEGRPFQVEPPADSLRQKILSGERSDLGALRLVDCLEIASENSRDYQERRESLYLSALDLTLERYSFRVHPTASLSALLSGTGAGFDSVEGGAGLGLSRLLGSGALIVGGLGTTLVKDLAHGNPLQAFSDLSLTITQPLLAGSGRRIVLEPLTQAERNVVYAVRSYERFRRTFAVDVAERAYRLLQQVDVVNNEANNYANLQVLRERNEALAQAGRLSDIQVDQALQDELRSKNRLIQERQRYDSQLDSFKFFLGLPITVPLTLDPAELEVLAQAELEQFELSDAQVDALALRGRLDYLTALDQVDDGRRRVLVAEDALRAELNVFATADSATPDNKPLDFKSQDVDWTLGAELDLPLDRFPQRNAFRESLITLEQRERAGDELADQIRVDVRDDLRQALATLETYKIQQNAVVLAERRVESARLNLEAGRASTRDQLESQAALLEARNAATRALIDYHLARLELFRDLELLWVDPQGIHLEEARLHDVQVSEAGPPAGNPEESPDAPPGGTDPGPEQGNHP